MQKGIILIIFAMLFSACSTLASPGEEEMDLRVAETIQAAGTATAAVETGVAQALTEIAPPPTEVPSPTPLPTNTEIPTDTPLPTDTPIPSPTNTPPTPSPTPTSTAPPTPAPCYKVLQDWCLSHQGCASISVLNKSDQPAKIFLKKDDWTSNISIPAGVPSTTRCTIVLRPDRYFYRFEFCGRSPDGYHALNDNWYIEFKCN